MPRRWVNWVMSRGPVARITHRIGFRGTTLLLLAVIDFAYGRTFVDPDPGQAIANRYLAEAIPFAAQEVSMWAWACAWWATGLTCLVCAFVRRDWLGYGAAIALKVAFVIATMFGAAHGMPNSTTRIAVWSVIAAWAFVEARRPEPQRDIGEVAREMEETGEIPKYPRDGELGHA